MTQQRQLFDVNDTHPPVPRDQHDPNCMGHGQDEQCGACLDNCYCMVLGQMCVSHIIDPPEPTEWSLRTRW